MTATLPAALRWPGYLAWVVLALLPISVLTVRAGSWQQGLLLYALACLLSLLLLAWFAVAALLPANRGRRPALLRHALPALPGAVLLVAALSVDAPPIHDISTDLEDPPQFDAVAGRRDDGDNSLATDPETLATQADAYPDIDTLRSELDLEGTFALAERTARALGWEIIRSDLNAGVIEAVDRTPFMGFEDDVVIRVRRTAEGSIVDLRSASRVGVGDLGTNAKRIRRFADAFREGA